MSLKAPALGLMMAALACLPTAAAYAETDTMTRVERTPTYVLSLSIGPAESTMDMGHGQTGDMAMGHDTSMAMGHDNGMVSDMADQGMAVNHHLEVHITRADTGAIVSDVNPTIRVTDKSTGASRDLPQVVGMGTNLSDWHYGQNVFLPEGTYHVAVLVTPGDTAMFRDVAVADQPMMTDTSMDHGMNTDHNMGTP